MLLCPLLRWAGWRLSLGQVIPEFYMVLWGRAPWGIITLLQGLDYAPPCSLVLPHFCYFPARGNWGETE